MSKSVFPKITEEQRIEPRPTEVIRQWLTNEQFVGFCTGNALEHLGRFQSKVPGKERIHELNKAIDYLEWAVEYLDERHQ